MNAKSRPDRDSVRQNILDDPMGNYPTDTVACFDAMRGDLPRRQPDLAANHRFLERLAAQHVGAVLIGASTGHGHVRTVDELTEWFRASATVDLRDTVPMALLRPEDGAENCRRLVSVLDEAGYPIVFVRPGTDLPANAASDEIAGNMWPIVEEAARRGMAVGVYSIPDVSGVALSPDAVANLLDRKGGENIVAVKITEANFESSTLQFFHDNRLSRLKIVQGWDPHLAAALQLNNRQANRCGVTSGPMSFALFQYQHILSAAARSEWDEVARAQQAISIVFASMQDDPTKFADLQRAKKIMGLGDPQLGHVTDEQIERVFTVLKNLPRNEDRSRIANSLDLLGDGPFHEQLAELSR